MSQIGGLTILDSRIWNKKDNDPGILSYINQFM